MSYRKRRSPTKGKRCVRYRRVRVRGQGMARRCVKYAGRRSAGYSRKGKSRSKKRGYFRRGHRPFNKGKRCVEWGRNKRGKRTCRSYGKVYGGKYKNRRRSRPDTHDLPRQQRTYENRMRRMMYENESAPSVPSWWAS